MTDKQPLKTAILAHKIPLVIDSGLLIGLFVLAFQGGALSQKVDAVSVTVDQIKLEQKSGQLPPNAIDKLARIETKLDRVIGDVADLSTQVSDVRRRN